MNFEELILKRESVRKYSNKTIDEDKINKILEAGRVAPTAKNLQPIKIYVIKSIEGLEKADKATRFRFNAPISLLICGDKDKAWVNDREYYPSLEVDSAIVATHMMLEATNLGIDSLWTRYFNTKILREELSIPDNLVPVCLLNLGYRSEDYVTNPLHQKRKSIEELVEYR